MKRLMRLLQAEPAALGSLLASILPALVLLDALQVDEKTIAALVVAVNALGGFAVRLAVMPSPKPRRRRTAVARTK
jgi:hypothetical protein